MSYKVAINGFGRIGRNAFKDRHESSRAGIVAINDLTSTDTLAYLLKHDSNYGAYHEEVGHDESSLIVAGKHIKVTAEKDPALLPWKDMGVDIVIESTGRFTKFEDASKHLQAGAKRVVISGPAKGEGAGTFVIGVNEHDLSPADTVVSNASCTTNCITPVAVVIEEKFGIEKAMMTTVHSYHRQPGPARRPVQRRARRPQRRRKHCPHHHRRRYSRSQSLPQAQRQV